MSRVIFILADGSERELSVAAGASLMQAATEAGLPGIIGECGGSAMCATCHVYVEADPDGVFWDPDPVEDSMLDSVAAGRRPNSRLSCQLIPGNECDGIRVRVAETQA